MKVFVIPNEMVFSPCKVDGLFWSEFHRLIGYLGMPEELVSLKEENPEEYAQVIDCLITFVRETEAELNSRGLLKEIEVPV